MIESPHDPTSTARDEPVNAEDAPPPAPPQELDPEAALYVREIQFNDGARDWIARVAGKGATGTGSYGLGMIEAVHFCHAEAPDTAVSEALLASGRFDGLYVVELTALLAGAVPIAEPGEGDAGVRGFLDSGRG